MQSVTALDWALDLRSSWDKAPEIEVYVDGKLAVDGNLNAITNPVIEVGMVHCRALLEFMGLCNDHGTLGQIKNRYKTDAGIEHFSNASGPLSMVDPEAALKRYKGDRAEAEKALIEILHVTNKGLAHNTINFVQGANSGTRIKIASVGVHSLMTSYFYTPMGWQPPRPTITKRSR